MSNSLLNSVLGFRFSVLHSRCPVSRSRSSVVVLLLTAYCSLFTVSCGGRTAGKSTRDVYTQALAEGAGDVIKPMREEFKTQQPLGYEEPSVPLLQPPDTRLIWIAPHRVGRRVFVHGHWINFILTDYEWNPEIEAIPGGAPAAPGGGTLPTHPESKPQQEPKP